MDYIRNWISTLSYDVHHPLLFNSTFFLFFFLLILVFYPLIVDRIKVRTWYLLLFSLYFYYKTSGIFIILLLATSLVNFLLGTGIHHASSKAGKRWLLVLSLFWNLGTLGYYKYTNFFINTINQVFGGSLPLMDIFLPVGISFFTFQTWSYTLDIYFGKLKPIRSFKDFAFFVSFFPQLVAGPIVRASYFIPQINKQLSLDKDTIAKALVLIFSGLLKKGVIADYISINFVDRVFQSPAQFSGVINLMGVYAYALQIYCDFSGYSDIAIGLAALLGFNLPVNFLTPYRASSITEFWRRWHISLSTWLRDYLYIPLGGNRKGTLRTYINLLITMMLGGLWHGASWNFVLWGSLHGVALAFDKLVGGYKLMANKWFRPLGVILTFHFVCFGWIFFRAPDFASAWLILNRIFTVFSGNQFWLWIIEYRMVAILIVAGYIFHWIPDAFDLGFERFLRHVPIVVQSLILAMVIWILFQARSADIQPFIYFQF